MSDTRLVRRAVKRDLKVAKLMANSMVIGEQSRRVDVCTYAQQVHQSIYSELLSCSTIFVVSVGGCKAVLYPPMQYTSFNILRKCDLESVGNEGYVQRPKRLSLIDGAGAKNARIERCK